MTLGGRHRYADDPTGPLRLTGRVRRVTDGRFHALGPVYPGMLIELGTCVVFDTGAATLLVAERRVEGFDAGMFTHAGRRSRRRPLRAGLLPRRLSRRIRPLRREPGCWCTVRAPPPPRSTGCRSATCPGRCIRFTTVRRRRRMMLYANLRSKPHASHPLPRRADGAFVRRESPPTSASCATRTATSATSPPNSPSASRRRTPAPRSSSTWSRTRRSSSSCRCSSPPGRDRTSRGSPTSADCRSTTSTSRRYVKDAKYWEANFGATLPWLRPTPGDKGIYGFMSQLTMTGPYVNKTLFEQAKVPVPGPKATWDEWIDATRKVAKATQTPFAMAWDRSGHRFAGPAISIRRQDLRRQGRARYSTTATRPRSPSSSTGTRTARCRRKSGRASGGSTYRDAIDEFKNGRVVDGAARARGRSTGCRRTSATRSTGWRCPTPAARPRAPASPAARPGSR